MLYLPLFTFAQKVSTFGASGRTAPTPTIAIARYPVSCIMTLPSSNDLFDTAALRSRLRSEPRRSERGPRAPPALPPASPCGRTARRTPDPYPPLTQPARDESPAGPGRLPNPTFRIPAHRQRRLPSADP